MNRPSAPERERPLSRREEQLQSRRVRGPALSQVNGRPNPLRPGGAESARLGQQRGPSTGHARTFGAAEEPPARRGWLRFVDRYGWRAYALPLLVVLTVLALLTSHSSSPSTASKAARPATPQSPASGGAGPADAASSQQLQADTPTGNSITTVLPSLALPPGPAYTTTGTGSFATIAGTSKVIGSGTTVRKFSIEVENGITGVNLPAFADTVMTALSNPQSWIADKSIALQRVDSGPVSFHISLVSSMTVRSLCGYSLPVETSCYDGTHSRVVLNVARWVRGAKAYVSDLATYRLYAVNHEVGHALGHNHAHNCLSDGVAPVMMQQTIGTKTASGQICTPNPWPYPDGVPGTPGAEQPGDGPDLAFFQRNAA